MTKAEFSRPISMAGEDDFTATHRIEADAGERAALAERLGLLALGGLKAEIHFLPVSNGALIRLEGKVMAQITQSCGVTLEPVEASISADFERFYDPAASDEAFPEDGDMTVPEGTDDPPEPIAGGIIDLGEVVAEQMSLVIDPFPRAAGAVFHALEPGSHEKNAENSGKGPFAVLGRLKAPPGRVG